MFGASETWGKVCAFFPMILESCHRHPNPRDPGILTVQSVRPTACKWGLLWSSICHQESQVCADATEMGPTRLPNQPTGFWANKWLFCCFCFVFKSSRFGVICYGQVHSNLNRYLEGLYRHSIVQDIWHADGICSICGVLPQNPEWTKAERDDRRKIWSIFK